MISNRRLVLRVSDLPEQEGREPVLVHAEVEVEAPLPKLKGSIGEAPNHPNFTHQSSVNILSKFNAFC